MKREEILLFLSALLFIQGYLFENTFPAILAFSIIAYLTYIRLEFLPRIEVESFVEGKAVEGEKLKLNFRIKNLGKKVKVEILNEKFIEKPEFIVEKEKEVSCTFIAEKGVQRLVSRLRIKDLRELYFSELINEAKIEVSPSVEKIREEAEIRIRSFLGTETPEVKSLRKFQFGDDVRRIDWKATARLQELIVKELPKEAENVYIILDASKEMRKSVKMAKIDYATTIALLIAKSVKKAGLIVYDEFGILKKLEPSTAEKIAEALKFEKIEAKSLSLKIPEKIKASEKSYDFLRKVLPVIKKRKSLSSGIVEAIGNIPGSGLLVFITDLTSNTSELLKALLELRNKAKIFLISPNPILFHEFEDDMEKILRLYRAYVEREKIIKKFSKIVSTIDAGPSDLLQVMEEMKCSL